jgi:hypothetical protein
MTSISLKISQSGGAKYAERFATVDALKLVIAPQLGDLGK